MQNTRVVLIGCLLCVVLAALTGCDNRSKDVPVGVGRSTVSAKIDLTDKLNPAILPDVLKEVFRELAPTKKPESKEFQQKVVQKLSQKIMDDPEVNYRVDLNEDGNIDPLLVVPETVEGKAAVYSLRVPDPGDHPKDPQQNADWHKIADGGIELVALSVTYDQNAQSMAINAESNKYVYEGRNHHHGSTYHSHGHNWMATYFQYMIMRDILFRPYGWYGPGFYGGWYGGFYGGWHSPVATRSVRRTVTSYNTSQASARPASNVARSSNARSRTAAPKAITDMKSKRAMAARTGGASRSGAFGSGRSSTSRSAVNRSSSSSSRSRSSAFGRSSSSSTRRSSTFRGGSRGFGK
ncbi:MAG: hypothetical protein OXN17_07345 [Candidatus Poribacteria bacterium]|nr:hypothetical protein [Candidatus Poribacteria bacterium]MDE0503811.1 hypothetical protein [Candidatus Poribacteria bacterium]